MSKVRIQKILAEAGVASRRLAEQMVLEGRVSINGNVVTALPFFADPQTDEIRVDGQKIRKPSRSKIYYLLNKPQSVVCTQRDPQHRPRAVDLVPAMEAPQRVYCVGGLDADSTGLVILTNDGELTEFLTHRRSGIEKKYVVRVDGRVEGTDIEKLRRGIYLDGGRVRPTAIKILQRGHQESLLELIITEGRNCEIRRLLARLGYKVRRLKRVAIGLITDRGLKIGHCRTLMPKEIVQLRKQGYAGDGRQH